MATNDQIKIFVLGGGGDEPIRFVTEGRERLLIDKNGVFQWSTITTTPTNQPKPQLFFRTDGGKQQLCVTFASGDTQILATEP